MAIVGAHIPGHDSGGSTIVSKLLALLFLLIGMEVSVSAQPQILHAGEYAPLDIRYGATVYESQCTVCHGPGGDRIAGVDLKSGRFRTAVTDDDLRRVIGNGIPGTPMTKRQLDPAAMTGIIAYLRNMRDFDSQAVPLGDPGRGQALFDGKGQCVTCHTVNGKGSHTGPDLSDIGSLRAASALQKSLLDPSSAMIPINRPIRIVTKDGRTISGRRLNEDTYTVQLINDHERLLSLTKADFREYTILTVSLMPSYKTTFNDAEISDIVAYLVSLKEK